MPKRQEPDDADCEDGQVPYEIVKAHQLLELAGKAPKVRGTEQEDADGDSAA